ncbi:hypothetical protein NKJ16_13115 [Mesorhizobium sp. M0179]|uniref:DNA ligase LigA-related protein n=1 Tax=unclassified Mesorhizobium TaxID=325217 RepID=UPI0003CEDD25|nr:hypothetical protein [Mesorhizobium sp. LSJC265A00]ESX10856.1 hypothetical protein X768_13955 [Mesorhizobium sp. LSJC265A00]
MPDIALENAERQRKQLLERKKMLMAELLGIDEHLGQIDRFIKAWHIFADGPGEIPGNLFVMDSESHQNKQALVRTERNSTKEEVAAAARTIIRERGVPMDRAELYAELTNRGMRINGKEPEAVMNTMLWRMPDHIARLKDGRYWLADEENQESGFTPFTGEIEEEARRLAETIAAADYSYHSADAPNITDSEYDKLRRRLNELRTQYPQLRRPIRG